MTRTETIVEWGGSATCAPFANSAITKFAFASFCLVLESSRLTKKRSVVISLISSYTYTMSRLINLIYL